MRIAGKTTQEKRLAFVKVEKGSCFKRGEVVDMKWFRASVPKKKKQFMERKGSPLKPGLKFLPHDAQTQTKKIKVVSLAAAAENKKLVCGRSSPPAEQVSIPRPAL